MTFISEYPEQVTDEVKETVESHTAALANKMKDDLAAGQDFFVAALEHMEDTETRSCCLRSLLHLSISIEPSIILKIRS